MTEIGARPSLAAAFQRFAERECAGLSPLYAALARATAEDDFLLALAARARPGQPPPNMLFAAVHALLLAGDRDHPLAAFYASLTAVPAAPEGAYPAFVDFCRRREPEIIALLDRRVVSTNEVRRAACLLPAFAVMVACAPGPIHMVEVGASAGLNLLWDRYAYDYGGAGRLAPPRAPLTLSCESRGSGPLPLPAQMPLVRRRVGIDPVPLDPGDPEDAAWLRALVWPEQADRVQRLETALRLAAALRPEVIAGDVHDRLPEVAAALPAGGTFCVFHSFTLNQFSAAARDRFETVLGRLGRARRLYRIALEWGTAAAPELRLIRYDSDGSEPRLLALCDAHGAWIDWRHRRPAQGAARGP